MLDFFSGLGAGASVSASLSGSGVTGAVPLHSPFVDYDSDINYLYSKQMDCIIQPVEKLGETAGELILRRIETPDAPAFEQVLTSTYQPCSM